MSHVETVENTLEKCINMLKKNSNSERIKKCLHYGMQSLSLRSESEAKSLPLWVR